MPKKAKAPEPVIEQSGVLPYRRGEFGLELLLVTSSDTGRWVPPKGNLEKGLTPRQSAAREAHEEAGLRGKVARKSIGRYRYRKSEIKGGYLCRVEVFPMEVSGLDPEWPEMGLRSRCWFPVKDAAIAVAEDELGDLMHKLSKSFAKV